MTPSRFAASLLPLVILALVIAVAGSLAAAPYLFLAGIDEEIAQSEQTLMRLRREIASESDLQRENRDLVALGKEANLLLEGSTTGIAGAKLQKLIADIVAEHGGVASSLQLLPVNEEGPLGRVALRLSINVDIDGLRDIVHAIETGTPLLFIDDLTVHTAEQKNGDTPDPYYLGPLEVNLEVSGYRMRDKAA